jgi:peptidoglycan/LPS O-acetylase OafA/YrhL
LTYHLGVSWLPGGFLGVSSFFTLSGFLITALLLTEHETRGRVALRGFWARRARRILPAAWLGLAGITLFGVFVADITQEERLRGDTLTALANVVNWWLIATGSDYADLQGSPSPVRHFWSLAIETQFYLLFPLLTVQILHRSRRSRRALALVASLLVVAGWTWMATLELSGASISRLYYGTDTRCAELFAGALLAAVWPKAETRDHWSRPILTGLGIAGLLALGAFWTNASVTSPALYRGGMALYTLATLTVLGAALSGERVTNALLGQPALRWLGRVSYGAYVYHWPIYLWLTPERTGLGDLANASLRIGLTLACASASYRLVEEPIRRGRRLRGRTRWFAPPACALVLIAAAIAFTSGTETPTSAPWAIPTNNSAAEASAADKTRVLVIGDSIASSIGNGLLRWGDTGGSVEVSVGAQYGCGVTPFDHLLDPDYRGRARTCHNWRARWETMLEQFRPHVVLVLTSRFDLMDRQEPAWTTPLGPGAPAYDRWLTDWLAQTRDELTAGGAQLVWLTTLCQKIPQSDQLFDPNRIAHSNLLLRDLEQKSRANPITLIDTFERVCPDGEFTQSLFGLEDARPDGIHFSRAGANRLAAWLGPQLIAARDHAEDTSLLPSRTRP